MPRCVCLSVKEKVQLTEMEEEDDSEEEHIYAIKA